MFRFLCLLLFSATMHLLSNNQNNAEAFDFCRQWLEHLCLGDYRSAHAMIVPNGKHPWTPELIEQVISHVGSVEPHRSGRIFRVTSPQSARGVPNTQRLRVDPDDDTCTGAVDSKYPFAVYWFLDGPSRRGALGWIHIDYPLNDQWSDLSSIFNIVPCAGALGLDLECIEVL